MMNRLGDWACRSCHHTNFQWRDSCQRWVLRPVERSGGDFLGSFGVRTASVPPSSFRTTRPDIRLGDWYCVVGNCGTHNFANRTTCFRCRAIREEVATDGGVFGSEMHRWRGYGFGQSPASNGHPAWRAGDWICNWLGCNEHNFAHRMDCFRCNTPRDSTGRSPFSS